jgi:type III restriction enzyme
MKIQFKNQPYQLDAVQSVIDCFQGQPVSTSVKYRIDPGRRNGIDRQGEFDYEELPGFRNDDLRLTDTEVLSNIQAVQRRQNLVVSSGLATNSVCKVNLDIEMETGTGKTYVYIKTMFELNRKYGWSKFIVVVPSLAIREGVKSSFEDMSEHFLAAYGKKARVVVYNSSRLEEIDHFSSDSGVSVMIINVQAFNATGKDARRIYEERDDFRSRRPIDVILKNRPILFIDEPQKMEGAKTIQSLAKFEPLIVLRYSATHKTEHNKVYRLDAIDAYNQKLVKKIAVRGVAVSGLGGSNAYLYLGEVHISSTKPPVAKVELEIKQASGIKRVHRNLGKGDNLFELSGHLEQYRGYVISEIDAITNTLSFANGVELKAGEAMGDVSEDTLRRIQIREAIRSHFEKEQELFLQGIKVLSLFFIDEVSKYRKYTDDGEEAGEYAQMFEEEYKLKLEEVIAHAPSAYSEFLKAIPVEGTHNGYFSMDKNRKLVNPKVKARGENAGEAEDDVDAYDLILKDKKALLEFPRAEHGVEDRAKRQVRFIFSHSALREGWDNPNVFVICTLKHSDNTISRRQEVGRGMRLCVNQDGQRVDDPSIVHQTNVLTVVASESYEEFVNGLQRDLREALSSRPRVANEAYFLGKVLKTESGEQLVSPEMAREIHRYLVRNEYIDNQDLITEEYHQAKDQACLAELPDALKPLSEQVFQLISSVFSDKQGPDYEDARRCKANPLNSNYDRKEFQALWNRINRKAIYTVQFESAELIQKCVEAINRELSVKRLRYVIQAGVQKAQASVDDLESGDGFTLNQTFNSTHNDAVDTQVAYDLVGQVVDQTALTRRTISQILSQISSEKFSDYAINPEDFIAKASRIINEQKATVIIQHLAYDMLEERYESDIFTVQRPKEDFSKAVKVDKHIYDYVFSDSNIERAFVRELDTSVEVAVYAKLPRGFYIPTPLDNYHPDWAIAFTEGAVKHIYFIAETKGSMSSLELRRIEEVKIQCARKFFAKLSSAQVKYDVVDSYSKLMELVS